MVEIVKEESLIVGVSCWWQSYTITPWDMWWQECPFASIYLISVNF